MISFGSPVVVVVATATTGVAGNVARVYVAMAKKFAAAEFTAGPVPPTGAHSASVSFWISVDLLSVRGIVQYPTFHPNGRIVTAKGVRVRIRSDRVQLDNSEPAIAKSGFVQMHSTFARLL